LSVNRFSASATMKKTKSSMRGLEDEVRAACAAALIVTMSKALAMPARATLSRRRTFDTAVSATKNLHSLTSARLLFACGTFRNSPR
jgi:hypothetical protein